MIATVTSRGPLVEWRHFYVRVGLARDHATPGYRRAIDTLHRLEAWLAANHRPVALFDAHGRPKSEAVSVFFERGEAEKALAYRAFCNELGLAETLLSGLVVHRRCPRTTPPG